MQRFRGFVAVLAVAAAIGVSPAARADAYADLRTALEDLAAQPGVQGDIRFPGVQTIIFELAGSERARLTLSNGSSELVIGLDVWVRQAGTWDKVPPFVAGAMSSNMAILRGLVMFPDTDKSSVRDLGMQKLNGGTAHVYTFTAGGRSGKLWIGAHGLPVEAVREMPKGTVTITYTYGGVTIEPPQ